MQAHILLFNRGQGFEYDFIPELEGFLPIEVSKENANLRDQLFLNVNHTDYHHIVYLSLLNRYPHIQAMLMQPHTAFSVEDYPLPASVLNNARLLLPGDGESTVTEAQDSLPINTKYTVEFLSEVSVRAIGQTFTRNYITRIESFGQGDTESTVTIDFDDQVPLNGSLVTGKWDIGRSFNLNYTPKSFPYERAYDLVTLKRDYLKILADLDLEDAFFNAYSKREKLAVIVLGLINHTYVASKS